MIYPRIPKEILSQTAHRPFPLPDKPWVYYQEWNQALFLHWYVPKEILETMVPPPLTLDAFEGNTWVSVVVFKMERIRPRLLPAVPTISNFDEINVRTYILRDNKPGVYFLSIEASKPLSSFIAQKLSGLPYENSLIQRQAFAIQAQHPKKPFRLDTSYSLGPHITNKTPLDLWLTERYCLYWDIGNKLFRYDIHHKEWPLQQAQLHHLNMEYRLDPLHLNQAPHYVHYSEGVQVLAWPREKL